MTGAEMLAFRARLTVSWQLPCLETVERATRRRWSVNNRRINKKLSPSLERFLHGNTTVDRQTSRVELEPSLASKTYQIDTRVQRAPNSAS